MNDVQNYKDQRGIFINCVGIKNLKVPFYIKNDSKKQMIVSDVEMGVSLSSEKKGTHMSRFSEITEGMRGKILNNNLFENIICKI